MPKKRLNFSKGECWSIRLNVRFATTLSSSNSSPKAATFSPYFSNDVAQQKQVSLTATPTTQATHQDNVLVSGIGEYYCSSEVE